MNIRGRVCNGVVVLDDPSQLPEGAFVIVSYPIAPPAERATTRQRVQLPLVPSRRSGTKLLESDRIAELLDDDDALA